MSLVTSAILVALIVIQGGFFSNSYLFFGMLLSLLLLIRGKMRASKPVFFSFGGILALYILSGAVRGFSFLQYLPAFQVLCCFVFYILISSFNEKERDHLNGGLAIAGIVVAILGLLSYTANLPIPAAVDNARLQSTLQYANAAAILFVLALFSIKDENGRFNVFRPVIMLALLLTLSFGGILAYCLASILYVFRRKRGERMKELYSEIAGFSIATVFAAGIYYFRNIQSSILIPVLLFAALCCLCPVWKRMVEYIVAHIASRVLSILLLGMEVGGILALRGAEAMGTLANRLLLISYGINALAANPVLGIGPGAWANQRGLYEEVYDRATIIHSSYVQIAVDAGIFALIGSVVIAIVFIKKQKRCPWRLSAVSGLLFHGILDLPFSFTGIVLGGIVVSADEERDGFVLPAWAVRIVAGGALAAFFIIDILF